MDATRHARIGALYRRVRRLSRVEAERLLAGASADDAELGREVEELLRYAEDGEASDGFSEEALAEGRARLEAAAARPAALDPGWIPESIGRYRIVRRIGVGGMGAVYEGVQEAPHRRVAVKVLHPLLVTEERVRRFRREVEVLGRLQHPGIAQVYEAGSADLGRGEQPWFAMELVEGVDLRTWAREKALDTKARLALVAEVADAVHHAHERGIVHRDLKPDNVLVDASGRPRVLDFGVARVTESSTALSTMETMQGQIVGTLTYMAPEQLAGDPEAVSARSDVYALGVIAFELLVGRRPIDAGELPVSAAVPLLLSSEATRLGAIDARLSGDVETIVGKALEKDPARRYASAAALAEDIRRHLAHRPIVARPPSALYRATKFTRRHRGLVGGTALAFVSLLGGFLGVLRYARSEARARAEAEKLAQDALTAGYASVDSLMNEALARVEAEKLTVDARAASYAALGALLDRGDVWEARTQLLRIPEAARGWEWRWLEARGPLVFPGLSGKYACWSGHWLATVDEPPGVPPKAFLDRSVYVVDVADPQAPRRRVEGLDGVKYIDSSDLSGGAAVEGLLRAAPDWTETPYQGAVGILDLEEARLIDILRFADRGSYGPEGRGALGRWITRIAGYRDGLVMLAGEEYPMKGAVIAGWSWIEVRRLGPTGTESTRRHDVQYPDAEYCRISPDGELAVVYPRFPSGPTVLVRIEGWQELGRIESRGGQSGPQFRPDGAVLASLAREDRVDVYEIPGLARVDSIDVPGANMLRWVGTDRWLVTGDDRIRILDAATGAVLEELRTGRPKETPRVSPNGRLVALGSAETELAVYELGAQPPGVGFVERSGHGNPVQVCAWSPDGSLLASAAPADPEILLWDGWTGEQLGRVPRAADPGSVDGVTRVPTVLFFASAEELVTIEPVENEVRRVHTDLTTGTRRVGPAQGGPADWIDCRPERIDDLLEGVDSTRGRAFGPRLIGHPDGRRVLCAPAVDELDNRIRVRGRHPGDDETLELPALGLALAPDQERLAIGGFGQVRIVSLSGGREAATIEGQGGPGAKVRAVAWSPDGERLAVGDSRGNVQLVETRTYRPILELPRHADSVASLAWSPDGTRLATASGDRTLRIFDSVHPIARLLQAEMRAERIATQAARLEALVGEHGDVAAAARALLAEAAGDPDARVAARHACLLRWNRR